MKGLSRRSLEISIRRVKRAHITYCPTSCCSCCRASLGQHAVCRSLRIITTVQAARPPRSRVVGVDMRSVESIGQAGSVDPHGRARRCCPAQDAARRPVDSSTSLCGLLALGSARRYGRRALHRAFWADGCHSGGRDRRPRLGSRRRKRVHPRRRAGAAAKLSARSVGLLTAFGAGALFAAVAYELVDEAGARRRQRPVGIGLIVGSLLYLFATEYWEYRRGGRGQLPVTGRDRHPRGGDHRGSLLGHGHIELAVIGASSCVAFPKRSSPPGG